eukprot:TRINITY_DN491_c0_g1_i1.p1 TRINITY_DN491_c0_g1~~TRINITY_DN491_c0_g1_i1.p1  ORF type:complete len:618 (+),score=230.77 TRINITY_DN491_c0_g1_i1:79-1854(+)
MLAAVVSSAAAAAFSMPEHFRQAGDYSVELLGGSPDAKPAYTETDVRIPTKDGNVLYTRVFFPADMPKTSAVLYQQVPYSVDYHKEMVLTMYDVVLKAKCNVVLALQETRSRYNSTGSFDLFRNSGQDAQDTYDWIKAQKWSNGNVFPWGLSAMGIKGFLSGNGKFPIKGQSLGIAATSFYDPVIYKGGAVNTGILDVILPFTNMSIDAVGPMAVAHEAPSDWWAPAEFRNWDRVEWPSVMWAGWYDLFQQSSIDAYTQYRKNSKLLFRHAHRLVIDPLGHCGLRGAPAYYNKTAINATLGLWYVGSVGMFTVWKDATNVVEDGVALVKWQVLLSKIPNIVFYVMGSAGEAGHFAAGVDDWPSATPMSYYLAAGGKVVTSTAAAGKASFAYDPAHPVPTLGGNQFQSDVMPCGATDQAALLTRPDVLGFTAAPLSAPMAITGRVRATLEVSSNATDTDFYVQLLDVAPNGTRQLVVDGIQRMRWRGGATSPVHMKPGETYVIDVDLWSTSWIFAAGHAVGVHVTSSNNPGFRPNPNTGAGLPSKGMLPMHDHNVTAVNTVHFGKSAVVLPIVKISDLTPLPPIKLPGMPSA